MYTWIANNRAEEIAKALRDSGEWVPELCAELCGLAGIIDEWDAADGESFESVIEKAAEMLGVGV